MKIGYGCCVGSWDDFIRYVVPKVNHTLAYDCNPAAAVPFTTAHLGDVQGTSVAEPEQSLVALYNQTSIATAYNAILDMFAPRRPNMVVLLHDDLEFIDPDAEAKFLAAINEPNVALAGVCGGGDRHGTMWWEDNPIGHQRIEVMNIDFAATTPGAANGPAHRTRERTRVGDVDVLEGSLLVFSSWAVENLRFDTEMPGFHGYDEICMQARRGHGKRCVVVDVDTFHHTTGGYKTVHSLKDWQTANAISRRKWGL